jgi:hypothetical protein
MRYLAIWHSIFAAFIFNQVSGHAGQFTAATPSISAS